MRAEWLVPARRRFLDYLAGLKHVNAPAAAEALQEIEQAVELLARRPAIGRPSRWPGLREWSLLRWKKLLVYRIESERILIVAFYDARQDMGDPGP